VLSAEAVSRGLGAAAQAADQSQFSSSTNAAAADLDSASGKLRLTIVAADSGEPVPNVKLDYWLWENGKVARKKPLQSTRLGGV